MAPVIKIFIYLSDEHSSPSFWGFLRRMTPPPSVLGYSRPGIQGTLVLTNRNSLSRSF